MYMCKKVAFRYLDWEKSHKKYMLWVVTTNSLIKEIYLDIEILTVLESKF